MKTLTKIQGLAQEVLDQFETRKRDNGESFYCCLKDGHPDWMKDFCREAHSDMLPDDWRYEFINEALSTIVEYDNLDDVSFEPDTYNHDLIAWLGSYGTRYGYVDEAVEDNGHGNGIIEDIMQGQVREKEEVFGLVRSFLENRVQEVTKNV